MEELYREAQRLIQSPYLTYALAGVFIVIWIVVSRVVGLMRRASTARMERPRRRLPL